MKKYFSLFLLPAFALFSCEEKTTPIAEKKPSAETWTKTELYFGLLDKNDTVDFPAFADTCISALFPDGYTLVSANGYWRPQNSSSTIQEPAMVLLLIHKNSEEEKKKIARIIASYKKRFHQESVLRFDHGGAAEF